MATFGLDSGDSTFALNAGYANAMRFQNDVGTGTLTQLELLFDDATPNGDVKYAVYADTGAAPVARLLDAGSVAVADGFVAISGLSLAVTLNLYYWLAFDLSVKNGVRRQTGQPANSHYYKAVAYATFPEDPWGAVGTGDTNQYVMRATVTVSGVARRIFITHS